MKTLGRIFIFFFTFFMLCVFISGYTGVNKTYSFSTFFPYMSDFKPITFDMSGLRSMAFASWELPDYIRDYTIQNADFTSIITGISLIIPSLYYIFRILLVIVDLLITTTEFAVSAAYFVFYFLGYFFY